MITQFLHMSRPLYTEYTEHVCNNITDMFTQTCEFTHFTIWSGATQWIACHSKMQN